MVRVTQMGPGASRSRSEEEAMRGHRRRRGTKRCSPPPSAQRVYGGGGPSTAWALLGNERALPASRRLVSGPTALVT